MKVEVDKLMLSDRESHNLTLHLQLERQEEKFNSEMKKLQVGFFGC